VSLCTKYFLHRNVDERSPPKRGARGGRLALSTVLVVQALFRIDGMICRLNWRGVYGGRSVFQGTGPGFGMKTKSLVHYTRCLGQDSNPITRSSELETSCSELTSQNLSTDSLHGPGSFLESYSKCFMEPYVRYRVHKIQQRGIVRHPCTRTPPSKSRRMPLVFAASSSNTWRHRHL
jgi:hypothetical protein